MMTPMIPPPPSILPPVPRPPKPPPPPPPPKPPPPPDPRASCTWPASSWAFSSNSTGSLPVGLIGTIWDRTIGDAVQTLR